MDTAMKLSRRSFLIGTAALAVAGPQLAKAAPAAVMSGSRRAAIISHAYNSGRPFIFLHPAQYQAAKAAGYIVEEHGEDVLHLDFVERARVKLTPFILGERT
jgi:hypothetical protein